MDKNDNSGEDEVENLRKQLQYMANLYYEERNKTRSLQTVIRMWTLREPMVQMLWEEICLLRNIISKRFDMDPIAAQQPSCRQDTKRQAVEKFTNKDRLAYLALRLALTNDVPMPRTLLEPHKFGQDKYGMEEDAQSYFSNIDSHMKDMENTNIKDMDRSNQEVDRRKVRLSTFLPPPPPLEETTDITLPPPPPSNDDGTDISTKESIKNTTDDIVDNKRMLDTVPEDDTTTNSTNNNNEKLDKVVPIEGASEKEDIDKLPENEEPKKSLKDILGTNVRPINLSLQSQIRNPKKQIDEVSDNSSKDEQINTMMVKNFVQAKDTTPKEIIVEKKEPQLSKPQIQPHKKFRPQHWSYMTQNQDDDITKNSLWYRINDDYINIYNNVIKEEELEKQQVDKEIKKLPNNIGNNNPVDNNNNNNNNSNNNNNINKDDTTTKTSTNKIRQPQQDQKYHNKISIVLNKMPKLDVMKKAIINLDDTIQPVDRQEIQQNSLPTADDLALVKNSKQPYDELYLPEKWIQMLSEIPQYEAHIECWYTSLFFDIQQKEYLNSINTQKSIQDLLLDNKNIRKYLAVVQVIGNYMNAGTSRGQADGFTIDSISRLIRARTTDGKQLLILVNKMCEKAYGENFIDDLQKELREPQQNSCTISLKQINTDYRKLTSRVKFQTTMSSIVIQNSPENERFKQIIIPFIERITKETEDLDKSRLDVSDKFTKQVQFFEPNTTNAEVQQFTTEGVLTTLSDLVNAIAVCDASQNWRKKQR